LAFQTFSSRVLVLVLVLRLHYPTHRHLRAAPKGQTFVVLLGPELSLHLF
jgi:hypothetical protein